jgi:hypothetical protein
MLIKKHIDVIQNFSDIAPSMLFTSGTIRIINQSKSVMGNYKWNEQLPEGVDNFGIYNVKKFCQILSFFNNPTVELKNISADDESRYTLVISEEGRKSEYLTTNPELVKMYYIDKEINPEKIGDPALKVRLEKETLKEIKNIVSVIQARHFIYSVEGDRFKIRMTDLDNSSSENYELFINKDKYEGNLDKEIVMFADDFALMEGSYNLSIYVGTVFKFDDPERGLNYYIPQKT